MNKTNNVLLEQYIQDSFHSYLKSSLTQAKAEGLLDADVLSSAESDLMITGPALCLYFAALCCTTNPPSISLPCLSSSKSSFEALINLSFNNCPPTFASFLCIWAHTVPMIQSLIPEHENDLARVICGLKLLSQPIQPTICGIAADLCAVAIKISQRRLFQDCFASDLQAALDSGKDPSSPNAKKALFVLPPLYDASPSSSLRSLVPPSPLHTHLSLPPSTTNPTFSWRTPSPTLTLLSPTTPAIFLICKMLYASLSNVLKTHPSIHTLLTHNVPRAYFASISLAILSVSFTSSSSPDLTSITCILGTRLTLSLCPSSLRPFMKEFIKIGRQACEMEEEDTEVVVRCVQRGEEVPLGRMERVRWILEGGVGASVARYKEGHEEGKRRSVQGRVVAFAYRINSLSLGMTRLRAFRERQDEVFKVLAGVGL